MQTQIEGKHLLLDTNLLIKIKDHLTGHFFDNFFQKLEKLNVKSAIEEATRFEFLRGARTQIYLEDKENFLNVLLGG